MKTMVPSLLVLFLLFTTSLSAQDRKTVFENVSLAKGIDGTTCMNLAWKKGTENTAYYLVQRSVDGSEFKTIALVFAAEDSSFTDYAFRDKTYASSDNNEVFYRIAVVSEEKEMAYLPVKRAVFLTASVAAPVTASPLVRKD